MKRLGRRGTVCKEIRILGTYASRENALFNMYPLLQYGMVPEDFDFELLLAHVDSRIGALYRTRKSLNILKDAETQNRAGNHKLQGRRRHPHGLYL